MEQFALDSFLSMSLNQVVRRHSRRMPSAKSKKKPVQIQNEIIHPEPVVSTEPPQPVVEPVVENKKKTKKQPKIVAVVTPNGIEGSFLPEPRKPLIARLQINSTDIQFNDAPLTYDPNPTVQPEPYDSTKDSFFTEQNQEIQQAISQQSQEVELEQAPKEQQKQEGKPSIGLEAFTKCDLLVEYKELKESKKIPETTNICCFWDVHPFSWKPCVIPEREEKGVYRVYGNFCSPNCALAYLLKENLDTHVRWERIALLHRLYGKQYTSGRIFPSPSLNTLAIFGGPVLIDKYRATIAACRVRVDLQVPPMVSILGSIDTKPIDFYDSSMKHTISPLLGEMVPKAEEGLRLKRSRPLKEKDSTLDSVLKIQIKGRG
jgi:hypothetical protein